MDFRYNVNIIIGTYIIIIHLLYDTYGEQRAQQLSKYGN